MNVRERGAGPARGARSRPGRVYSHIYIYLYLFICIYIYLYSFICIYPLGTNTHTFIPIYPPTRARQNPPDEQIYRVHRIKHQIIIKSSRPSSNRKLTCFYLPPILTIRDLIYSDQRETARPRRHVCN